MAPDLLSTIRHEIDERLSELRPLLDEHERLLDAAAALEMAGGELDVSGASRRPMAALVVRRWQRQTWLGRRGDQVGGSRTGH